MQPHTLTVFDLDNSLAENSETYIRPALFNFLYGSINSLKPMDFESFMVKMNEFNSRGLGIFGWANHLGLQEDWVHEQIILMGPVLAEATMANLKPNPQVHTRLQTLQERGHALAIYTHGHAGYARPVVQHLGFSRYFPEHAIYDITTNNRTLKTSASSYQFIVNEQQKLLGTTFTHFNMVEDNATNLHAAKQAGFKTILISTGDYPPEENQLIDTLVPNLTAALDTLLSA